MAHGDATRRALAALEAAGASPTAVGEGWQFFCPSHADGQHRAGELAQGERGALLCCHAGCGTSDVLAALGLTMSELFDAGAGVGVDWEGPDARYVYRGAGGGVVHEVRRWGWGRSKVIRPVMPSGRAGLPPAPERVLYRLPELLAAVAAGHPVLVTEGERDAEAAVAAGYPAATTNVGGAGKWRRQYDAAFAGAAMVVVARHRDQPGRDHAAVVAASLLAAGVGPVVVVEALTGNDLVDHLGAGHSLDELVVMAPDEGDHDHDHDDDKKAPVGPPPPRPGGDREWPVLGDEALHGPLGAAVRAAAGYTEADPAAVLACLLCAAATAVGPGPRIYAGMEPQPTRLQVWVVGDSALGRKGTAWGVAAQIMAVADPRFSRSRMLSGFGSGEAIIDALADPEANDCRLLVLATEGAQLLNVMARRGDLSGVVLRNSYDTDRLAVRSRAKTSVVELAHLGVLALITPTDLVAGMSSAMVRNGMANRGLFFLSRRACLIPRGGAAPPGMRHAAAVLGDAIEAARPAQVLGWAEEAARTWDDELYPAFGTGAPGPVLADMEARGDVHCVRLALLYAALDGSAVVRTEHLGAAMAVWRYCQASARHLFAADGMLEDVRELTPHQRDARAFEADLDALAGALIAAGSLTGAEQHAVFWRNRSSAHLGRLRRELVARGVAGEQALAGTSVRLLVAVER